MIILIAAMGQNRALGKDNKMIWHLPDDFKHFKTLTTSHYIIMGRKTFETFPSPLPNRVHVIITRQLDYVAPQGCIVVHSLDQALQVCQGQKDVYVIGGAQIYELALEIADKIELTKIHEDFQADAFFPEIDQGKWDLIKQDFHPKDSRHAYDFTFLTYIKK
ncbi:dihydrofolate reductase [Myroides sp. LJL119]